MPIVVNDGNQSVIVSLPMQYFVISWNKCFFNRYLYSVFIFNGRKIVIKTEYEDQSKISSIPDCAQFEPVILLAT